jgi:predicted Zn-dependent protease
MGAFARERLLSLGLTAQDVEATLAAAEKSLAANPKNPVAMNNVAACLLLLERHPARALELATAAHATRTNFAHFADTHASALVANSRGPEAVAIYESTDLAKVKDPAVWLGYAHALFLAGRVPEARAMLTNVNQKALLPQQAERCAQILGSASPTD